ncbi:hypothetical protein UR09_04990 [Candidatus Nitromaritima sp. SCGC AAA799-A02]|nr:hypothetical protein UR09_04990 [Candidatus Nitromaritima sp. SCGC AAA799-A02]
MTEKSYYERYWEKCLGSYDKGVAQLPPDWQPGDLERVLSFCRDKVKGRVLDAGCGDGFFAQKLSELTDLQEITGIDVSERAIEIARTKYPNLNFLSGELNHIPLDDSSCDFVSFVEVIEHLVDVDGTLEEIARVLKPGGILLITTTDFNWLKSVIIAAFFFEKYFYPTNPHIRFFTRRTLEQVLSSHGLSVVKYAWHGSYFGIMPKGQMVLARK